MQCASGQYDHLARVPRTGPRQSRSRRPLTARHRCRAAPRRARGMDPTVRNPRIETAIATPWGSRTALFASQDFPWLPHAIRRTKPRRRERNFRMQRPAAKIHPRGRYCRERPGTLKIGGKNPRRNGLFTINDGFRSSGRLGGGVRSRMRTRLSGDSTLENRGNPLFSAFFSQNGEFKSKGFRFSCVLSVGFRAMWRPATARGRLWALA